MDLQKIQESINQYSGDAWVFYDFHNRDEMAYNILGLDFKKPVTRRWFYIIPKNSQPIKIVSVVESKMLDSLPGEKFIYKSWEEMLNFLDQALHNLQKVFMQYSPNANVPSISVIDAGTIELIKSLGKEILSSANLVQVFEAAVSEKGFELHQEAGIKVQKIKNEAFSLIMNSIRNDKVITEYDVQNFILNRFDEENLTCDHSKVIVAVNDHAADPHFELLPENSNTIKRGDRILIDLWARVSDEEGIYYDITWCGYTDYQAPVEYAKMFDVVVNARKIAKNFIREKIITGEVLHGWEVDHACREYIHDQGYGDYFVHRTGHSIQKTVHGNGVNLDNLETKDDRLVDNGLLFSIEPGIYKEGIGVRTEINVMIKNNDIVVIGEEQEELILLDYSRDSRLS